MRKSTLRSEMPASVDAIASSNWLRRIRVCGLPDSMSRSARSLRVNRICLPLRFANKQLRSSTTSPNSRSSDRIISFAPRPMLSHACTSKVLPRAGNAILMAWDIGALDCLDLSIWQKLAFGKTAMTGREVNRIKLESRPLVDMIIWIAYGVVRIRRERQNWALSHTDGAAASHQISLPVWGKMWGSRRVMGIFAVKSNSYRRFLYSSVASPRCYRRPSRTAA